MTRTGVVSLLAGMAAGAAAIGAVWAGSGALQAGRVDTKSPEAVVKLQYDYFGKANIRGVQTLIAPDAPWTQYGPEGILPFAGKRKGPQGVADFFNTVDLELTDVIHRPREYIAAGDVVIVPGTENSTVRATGSRYLAPTLHMFRVRDGKIVEFEEYIDSGTVLEGYALADASRGKAFYTSCAACHGNQGEGRLEMYAPPLTGQLPEYVLAQLRKFHSGARGKVEDLRGFGMQGRVSALPGDRAMRDTAAFIATLPTPAASASNPSDAAGRQIYAASCAQCHGPVGEGNSDMKSPSLRHLTETYIAAQLHNFRKGLRGYAPDDAEGQAMAAAAKTLPDEAALTAVARHIGQ